MGQDKKIHKTVPALKAPSIDFDEFQDIWDDPDIPDDQKLELFEILWRIALDFVDMGFGMHSVQLATNARDNENQNHTEQENQPERSDV